MPFIPVSATPLETYMPPYDMRNAGKAAVIDGENFIFDSSGPKSGFTTRLLTPDPLGAPLDVQSIEIQGRTFVFTADAILTWPRNYPQTWVLLYAFSSAIPEAYRAPWSAIFLEGELFFAHPYRGLFSAVVENGVDELLLIPKTSADIPGLIAGIRGMAVVHGRPILVNDESVQWGNVGDMYDLTPALAGPGYQLMSAYVQGKYLGLSSFQDGFLVWTDGGQLVAEFIDGDLVWDWYPLVTQEKPVNHRASLRMTDGSLVFLSGSGLMLVENGVQVKAFSPDFNEYFLTYLESESTNLFPRQYWRLGYDAKREMLYLSESSDGALYHRAFVFAPTREKWGLLNELHYGIISPAEDTIGFVDQFGYVRYIDEYANIREYVPEDTVLVDRHHPRREKQMLIPSSSAVSNAYAPDLTLPQDAFVLSRAGWYFPSEVVPAPPVPGPLNSWIDVGFVRTSEMNGLTAELLEIHEMTISSIPISPPEFVEDYTLAHHDEDFRGESEDWDSDSVVTMADIVEDWNVDSGAEDWLSSELNVFEDWNLLSDYVVDYDDEVDEDWEVLGGDEDWDGKYSGLTPYWYDVKWLGSDDGITFDEAIPELARFGQEGQMWSGFSSGAYHRIRISTGAWPTYYKVSLLNLRLQYGGRIL